MSFNYNSLNSAHIDILKEISNIGSGNAITALSKMLKKNVIMKVPDVKLLAFDEMAGILGSPEEIVFGTLISLSGDISGMMMFLVKEKSARIMINGLIGETEETDAEEFSELDLSAMTEVANILSSCYLRTLAAIIDKKILQSVPYLARDMAGAILSVPAIEFGKVSDQALFIENVFVTDDNEDVSGYFLLVPDMESFNLILSSLGVN